MKLSGFSQPVKQSATGLVVFTLAAFTSVSPVKAQALQPPPTQPQVPPSQVAPPAAVPQAPQPGMMTPVPATNSSSIQQFDQESYLLGPGDVIGIELFSQPDVSKSYQVLIDGTVSLPMVGNVPVRGLTLKQAAAAISAQYLRFYKRPIVTTRLERSRPITIGVSGQVFRPGTYIVGAEGGGGTGGGTAPSSAARIPKVTFAIQSAGGITPRADVRSIQVRRPQMGRPDMIINVDLMRLLDEGDLSQDVLLRDGDSIVIREATTPLSAADYNKLALTTFSPSTINVNVVGEVRVPGLKQLTPNTPINNAIMAAGSFVPGRANPNKVQLIRINPDGTVTQRQLKIDFKQGLNADANPVLQNNDVIVVGRSGIASFSDSIGQVLAPFNGITGVVTGGLGRLILPVP
jgi:polysaccharide biosynthesis/export protein